jgi:quinol monooxygenase YgiN
MVHIVNIAQFKAKLGQEQALGSALKAILKPTRGEPGCIRYDLVTAAPDIWVMIEEWRDEAAISYHLEQPYIVELLERLSELLANPPKVETFQSIN